MPIIEENRLKNCVYLSGTGTGKVFRSTDNTSQTTSLCSMVPRIRVYFLANPLGEWSYTITDPDHEDLFESIFTSYNLTFDSGFGGCHWTASQTDSGGGLTGTISWDLVVTVNGGNPALVDLLLTVTITVSGGFSDTHAVSYLLEEVDPTSTGPFTLTSTTDLAGRTWTIAAGNEIVWPTAFEMSTDPVGNVDVARQVTIRLSDVDLMAGTATLNFDVYRAADPNDPSWYLEYVFTVPIGSGTDYETVGDIEGHEFVFEHDGDDNANTGNGTEDATVKITIEHVALSNALP